MDIERIHDGDALGIRWPGAEAHLYRPGDDRGAALAFVKAVKDGVYRGEVPQESTAREVAQLVAGRVGIRKDASGDLIIAWWLPEELARELVIAGGVEASAMHLTLLYLGDPEGYDLELVSAIVKLRSTMAERCEGVIGGMGRFVGDDETDVVVALVDVPGLDCLRRNLKDDLMCYGACPPDSPLYEEEHGYVPHITLGYLPKLQGSPPPYTETTPIVIDNLTVAAGPQRASFEIPEHEEGEEPSEDVAYSVARATKSVEDVSKRGRMLSAATISQIETALGAMQDLLQRAASKEAPDDDDDNGLGDDVDKAGAVDARAADADAEGSEATPEVEYHITKANGSKRYTLGPLYAPNRKDAHGEYVDADTLQEAVWDYVRQSRDEGGRLRLQHGDGEVTVGEWVEVMAWPYDHQITLKGADGEERQLDMPAGTVYMGVVWDEEAWPLVKTGKLGGYSLGGRAVKVSTPGVDLDLMGDAIAPPHERGDLSTRD